MIAVVCRLCGSTKLETVIDLGFHPIADTFLLAEHLNQPELTYPLRAALCAECGYVGLEYLVPAETRYQGIDYSYTSANSAVSIRHFAEVAQEVCEFADVTSDDLVIDAGSNDGTLLKAFHEKSGCSILGIDPAPNIAELAIADGVPTIVDFFCAAIVPEVLKLKKPKVIFSANALNHASDPRGFLEPLKSLMNQDSIFVFEVPYLLNFVEKTAFDTMYLEHVSYYGVKPLKKLLESFGLTIVRIEWTDYMLGSIRVYAGNGAEDSRVSEMISVEEVAGLYSAQAYSEFMQRVHHVRLSLCKKLYDAKAQGKRIAAIGAATKGNTLLNFCKLDSAVIDFITDVSPLKLGKFTPGSHIFIKSDDALDDKIDVALILPRNLAGALNKKLQHLECIFVVSHEGIDSSL